MHLQQKYLLHCIFNALHWQLDCDWPPHYIPITGWITSRQPSPRQSLLSYGHRHEDEYQMKLKFNLKLIKKTWIITAKVFLHRHNEDAFLLGKWIKGYY